MNIEAIINSTLSIKTFTKEEDASLIKGKEVKGFTLEDKEPLILRTNDEIPFVVFNQENHHYAALVIDKKMTLEEALLHFMQAFIKEEKVEPTNLFCYLGPSLTFSHTPVERKVLLDIIKHGYQVAAKRTDKIDYLDLPIMNVAMLRKIGIPFSNIVLSQYDTYEAEPLLYSALRGDEKKNVTLVKLLDK